MKTYMPVVAGILNAKKPPSIVDAPSGNGWLHPMLQFQHDIDGVDLFEGKPDGYSGFVAADLEEGIPDTNKTYHTVVSCEGIEHLGNPLAFLVSARKRLHDGGLIVITTPNVWFPGAKLKYFLNGFFPSFPPLVGKVVKGTHMHITPWSFPHLYLYLELAGFEDIHLHDVPDEKKPKHFYERILAIPQRSYCSGKARKAASAVERSFWNEAGSDQSTLGRRLVVSATAKAS